VSAPGVYGERMADALDLDAMIQRFRDRAHAVKNRPLPPIAGDERTRFVEQAQNDFQDFALIGDSTAELVDGILTFTVDLRPPEARGGGD
jgi:hypothetical protein